MKQLSLSELRKEMEDILEPKRYEHTLGVAYTAANLAVIHGEDTEKALVAGMLHDCAKCISFEKQRSICLKHNVELSEPEKFDDSCGQLLHAKAGAVLAKEKYGIENEDILNAIFYHTTGRPGMSLLEKIIYIADYIEPGRKHIKGTAYCPENDVFTEARRTSFRDLDEALVMILENTLAYLHEKGCKIDPATQLTYDYYSSKLKLK